MELFQYNEVTFKVLLSILPTKLGILLIEEYLKKTTKHIRLKDEKNEQFCSFQCFETTMSISSALGNWMKNIN